MKKLLILFLFAIVSCKTADHPMVIVTGTAESRKAGAILVTESDAFYLDGIESWSKEYLDNKVTVSGWLTEVNNPKIKDSIQIQAISGPIKLIKKSRIIYPEGLHQQ